MLRWRFKKRGSSEADGKINHRIDKMSKSIQHGWTVVERAAKKEGIDLSDPRGLDRAREKTLPPAKRKLTHNPFAALATKTVPTK